MRRRNRLTIQDRVLAALSCCGKAETGQLVERLGLIRASVQDALKRLERQGKVVRYKGQGYKGGDLWGL